jgi:lipoprotein-releasing system ATP-binding protein
MKILIAKNISKSFTNKANEISEVLKNISFEIEKGKITSIMGASGVGKSTLLYILGTLEKPDNGSIHLNIQDKEFEYSKLSDKELTNIRNKHIGFIFQFHHLLPEFSVLENIMLPALILGTNNKIAEENAFNLMQSIGTGHIKNKKPSEISGGEQQRAAIARALINSPDIIFADEPTGNLDSQNANSAIELIKSINIEKNITFLIATHSEQVAAQSHSILKMKDGNIV